MFNIGADFHLDLGQRIAIERRPTRRPWRLVERVDWQRRLAKILVEHGTCWPTNFDTNDGRETSTEANRFRKT